MTNTLTFQPDWLSPPGETIADVLEDRDWTQTQLAERLGYTTKHVSQLITGKASISEETALKLERVLGSTAVFWLNREAQYRATLAKLEEANLLSSWTHWLDELPVKNLMDQGVIQKRHLSSNNKPSIVKDLLAFFGVASPEDWRRHYVGMQASFRQTRPDQCDVGAISAWLRRGEIEVERLASPKYNKAKFEKAVKEIRSLTVLSPNEFMPQMRQFCWDAGVVFLLVPSIPRAHTSGVARWLNPHRPIIQLSNYGKTNDKFWFNFFHEVAHILLHDGHKKDIFLDDFGGGQELKSRQEDEANHWSRDFLIPSQYASELCSLNTKEAVIVFAEKLGIHPAIVVGRLQHEKIIPINWMNDLKESINAEVVISSSPSNDEFDQAVNYVLDKNQELYECLS